MRKIGFVFCGWFFQVGVSKNNCTPKSSILIGFSIIFTIHFGGKIPLFLVQHPGCGHFQRFVVESQHDFFLGCEGNGCFQK